MPDNSQEGHRIIIWEERVVDLKPVVRGPGPPLSTGKSHFSLYEMPKKNASVIQNHHLWGQGEGREKETGF